MDGAVIIYPLTAMLVLLAVPLAADARSRRHGVQGVHQFSRAVWVFFALSAATGLAMFALYRDSRWALIGSALLFLIAWSYLTVLAVQGIRRRPRRGKSQAASRRPPTSKPRSSWLEKGAHIAGILSFILAVVALVID